MKKRMFAMLLAMVMVLSLLPVSAFAADVVIVPAAEDGWEEIGTVTGSSYEDTTAESDTEYEYMVVGSDGSTQTVAVTAETPDGGTGDTTGGDETYDNAYGTATKTTSTTTTEGSTCYELVTNGVNGITSGEEYLIVSSSSGAANALTIAPGRTSVQITDGKITSVDSSAVFTITGNATNGYTLKNGDNYIRYNTTNNGHWNSYTLASGQNSQAWTLSNSGTNGVTISTSIQGWSNSTTYYIRYSNNSFSLNSIISSTLYLFKKVVEPGETVTTTTYDVTWNEAAQELLDTCNDLNRENYTEETWTPFAEALEAANAAKAGQTSFDTMDAAKTALDTMTALKEKYDALALVKTEVSVPNIQWERTLEPAYTGTSSSYTSQNGALVRNLTYISDDGTGNYPNITWDKTSVRELTTDSRMTVWDYNTTAQYAATVSKVTGVSAATWHNWNTDTNWMKASVRKISGTFTWPEGYDLDDTITLESVNDANYQAIYDYINENETYKETLGSRKVIAINDDMYVYVYLEGDENGAEMDDSYLAFFTGSVGKGIWCSTNTTNGADWKRTVPASYNGKYATRAFYNAYPNLSTNKSDVKALPSTVSNNMKHTDGWYTFADGNSISSVLREHYTSEDLVGKTIHIDIYCFDNSGDGGMDELQVKLTRQKENTATVTVNYYLNSVSGTPLASSSMPGVQIGTGITLTDGYEHNMLNYAKAMAIEAAGNKDVTDGEQQGTIPYTVVEGENVINVVYTVKDDKAIDLHAGSAEVPYDGKEHTVTDYDVKMNGQKILQNADGTYTTVDGNYIQNVIGTQGHGTLPGKYEITVNYNSLEFVKDKDGYDVTNSYKVTTHPGTLTITYAPEAKTYTYDFGVANKYGAVLDSVELNAESVTSSSANAVYDKTANTITYTPSSVNTGETVTLTLTFIGGYTTTKTINFLPATNVLYEEGFVSTTEDTDWKNAGTAAPDMTVTDNETTAYGYTEDTNYTDGTEFSAGTALKAVLTKDQATRDATFTFTGTGFDLISECGTNTGMLLVGLKDANDNAKAGYLVDTYFCGDEEYVNGTGILAYQVPVIRELGLEYGTYTVTVKGYLTKGSGAVNSNARGVATMALEDADAFSVEQIFAEAGMSEYLSADVEIVYMDDNSILNGGIGPEITETTVTDTTEDTSATESTGVFGKLRSFFKNLGRSTTLESAAPVAENTQATEGTEISAYIDGFRVYQPKGTEESDYETDEQETRYYSLYDFVKTSVNEFEWVDGAAVYIEYDGSQSTDIITEYKDQGPQNEVYLAPGASIVFGLQGYEEDVSTVQVAAKQINAQDANGDMGVYSTATEMYYDVTGNINYDPKLDVYYVVITNDADAEGILALSGLKVSQNITAMASQELANNVIELKNAENAAFQPEKFSITAPSSAKAKKSYTIKFSTSTDVDHIVIQPENGDVIELTPTNKKAVESGRAEFYTFSKSFKQSTAGDYTYTITAYDEEGNASVATDVTVKVK